MVTLRTVQIRAMAKTNAMTESLICSFSPLSSGLATTGCFGSNANTDGFIYFAVIDLFRGSTSGALNVSAVELY
jgi:hypothetical protein